MFKLALAMVLLWALMTSGVRVGDLAATATRWAVEHVEVSVR